MLTIDLSSDDDEPTQEGTTAAVTNTHTITTPPQIQTVQRNSQLQSYQGFISFEKMIDFIDRVVMIWLCRVQKGYKNVQMPSNILKTKAEEAANVLGVGSTIFPPDWQSRFEKKVHEMFERGDKFNLGKSNSIRIEEIIRAEMSTLFLSSRESKKTRKTEPKEKSIPTPSVAPTYQTKIENKQDDQLSKVLNEQKKHLEQVKQAQLERIKAQNHENLKYWNQEPMKKLTFRNTKTDEAMTDSTVVHELTGVVPPRILPILKPKPANKVLSVADVLKDPIQSYEEAIDCLRLIENYLLSVRNRNAVLIVNKIEEFLRDHINS